MAKRKKSFRNRVTLGDVINSIVLLAFTFLCLYPFWYIFIGSISNPNIPVRTLTFLPKDVTLFNYKEVLQSKGLLEAMGISVARTVTGTLLSVLLTAFMAYLFTLQKMPARKFFYRVVIVTMYLSGGLIPTFLVYKSYGLLNTFWVYIIPGAVSVYNMVLVKTFLENGIPESLGESASLDGAGPLTIFFRIMLPLSLPILATIALFVAVGQWNSWFDNMIYNTANSNLDTLQYLLYKKLNEANKIAEAARSGNATMVGDMLSRQMKLTPDSIRMTITMLVTLPILCVYPFLQKYFVKGIMVGAVKG
ncbi:MAG: carbohydrate ABC transporter permease [Lachnospiraceae bacterium]|jgi:putative aldouronate transport system permease protein|nr:carbohydrate ABC transporter permease [uncultured Acetatifactor sp.]MCI9230404.1 carbohydrate ABC transporter permease [Lachnospiraceae bacterium]